ncbi:hypothetical protein GURASL_12370 [Geotalea uraniireducens]|uniref:CBS domain-containing protein n=1 Tax=Geotalea uraniireducens TaxID=351604 RepID=A0ABM8EJ92_9BACT|nr:SpoIIE family protein phosphatase [Geotalea uraniireducens]BDV42314.1 hypothetical protein GURASL_12370 [Geotalea uraniireducens]
MENRSTTFPKVREIAKPVTTISAELPVREVVALFRADQSLPAIPVTADERFVGLVDRRTLFFRQLAGPYAMELFGRKPISQLLDRPAAALEPHLDVNHALKKLLELDPTLEVDSVAVVDNGTCHGVVAVSDLMMAISDCQALLLSTLERLSARIRDEVDKAAAIQQALLPPPTGSFPGIEIGAGLTTSSEVSGDFYDYFPCGGNRVGLVIGDVSGHGVQAGMVTTAAKAALHTLAAQGTATPRDFLCGMNKAILATARQFLLMSCIVAIIDPAGGELCIANAGHNFPYLCRQRQGEAELLEIVSGFPLGFDANCVYSEYRTTFAAGDLLFLYTDGIVECTDAAGEEFGYGRLEELLRRGSELSPVALRDEVLAAARRFSGSKVFADDVTILIAAGRNIAPYEEPTP